MHPSVINRLESQHQSIQVILSTIDSNRIKLRQEGSKWNIHDTVAHLVSYQQMFIDRMGQILSEEVPFFGKYDADNDPDFEYWRTNDMEHLITQLLADRGKLSKVIKGLNESDGNRIGMDKKYGSHNVIQWTEYFLLHEAHHIFHIFQLAYNIETR